MSGGIYLDLDGVVWFVRRDLVNVALPDGSEPFEIGYVDAEGSEVTGDWLPEADALEELKAMELADQRRAEDYEERRMGRDW